jgi:hypothetical protein
MDNEGEGKVTPVPPVKESAKTETLTSRVEQTFPTKTEKPTSGWQKKLLGIPVWGWVIIGLLLVWAGVTVGIVASH